MAERVQGKAGGTAPMGLKPRAALGASAAPELPAPVLPPPPPLAPKARNAVAKAAAVKPNLEALEVPEPPSLAEGPGAKGPELGDQAGQLARLFGGLARGADALQSANDALVGAGDVAMNAGEMKSMMQAGQQAITRFMGRLPEVKGGEAAAKAGESGLFAWAGKAARPLGMMGMASGLVQATQAFRAEGGPDLMGVAEGLGNATSALADAIGKDFTLSGSYGSALTGLGKVCSVGAVLGGALCVFRNAKALLKGTDDEGKKLEGASKVARVTEMLAGAAQAVAGVMMFVPGLQPLAAATFAIGGALTLTSMAADHWETITAKASEWTEGAQRHLAGFQRQLQTAPA